jgi:hypothetical protein
MVKAVAAMVSPIRPNALPRRPTSLRVFLPMALRLRLKLRRAVRGEGAARRCRWLAGLRRVRGVGFAVVGMVVSRECLTVRVLV